MDDKFLCCSRHICLQTQSGFLVGSKGSEEANNRRLPVIGGKLLHTLVIGHDAHTLGCVSVHVFVTLW